VGKVKSYKVELCDRSEIKVFIETHHYSHNINGVKSDFCFKLIDNGEIIGAMIYGGLGMANTWKKYSQNEKDILELRRLCCVDNTPKNTESYFIGHTLRWLKKNTDVKKIISYADTTYSHEGIIYKASNFKHVGMTQKGKAIEHNGRLYHDKTIRTKYKGKLKPFAQRIKDSLERGESKYVETKGKHIYIYELK
jgi:hypothetical protein